MKTVAICGSMRYESEMKKIAFDLEANKEFCVLQCVYNEEKRELSDQIIERLNKAHCRKIQLADAIYVVDIDGYIGEQVRKEITFAEANSKEIIFHSDC